MLVYIEGKKKKMTTMYVNFHGSWMVSDVSVLLYIANETEITKIFISVETLEKGLRNEWDEIVHMLSGIHCTKSHRTIM